MHLSPITHDHIAHLIDFSGDPELVDAMGWHPFSCDECERFIKTIETPTLPDPGSLEAITFCIIDKDDLLPIGYANIKGIHKNKSNAEISIAIMDKRYRSGGYGTGALKLIVDYAFNTINLASIALTVFSFNTRAVKVYEKIGFKVVSILKKSWSMPNGKKVDMLLMELNKNTYYR